MRETEEVERFGLSLATTLSVVSGGPPKLDQARLVGVQLQGKLAETFPQVLLKLLGIRSVFEAHHESSSPGESHPQAALVTFSRSLLVGRLRS